MELKYKKYESMSLKYKKYESMLVPIRKKIQTIQTNEHGYPLFVIEKVTQGRGVNKYKLFSAIPNNDAIGMFFGKIIHVFDKRKDAKRCAELLYENSKYSKKPDGRKKAK